MPRNEFREEDHPRKHGRFVPRAAEAPATSGVPATHVSPLAVATAAGATNWDEEASRLREQVAGSAAEDSKWAHAKPIWPRRDVVDAIVAEATGQDGAGYDADTRERLRRALRSLYRRYWMEKFSARDPERPYALVPREPDSDQQGWQWRTEVLRQAQEAFRGAHPGAAGDTHLIRLPRLDTDMPRGRAQAVTVDQLRDGQHLAGRRR